MFRSNFLWDSFPHWFTCWVRYSSAEWCSRRLGEKIVIWHNGLQVLYISKMPQFLFLYQDCVLINMKCKCMHVNMQGRKATLLLGGNDYLCLVPEIGQAPPVLGSFSCAPPSTEVNLWPVAGVSCTLYPQVPCTLCPARTTVVPPSRTLPWWMWHPNCAVSQDFFSIQRVSLWGFNP